jgi:hypothetical protein
LTVLLPAQGSAGQVVTLEGTALFSADGHISVSFGPVPATVQCPTETTCRATVPDLAPGPRTVMVKLATQSGASNGLAFAYRPSHGRNAVATSRFKS